MNKRYTGFFILIALFMGSFPGKNLAQSGRELKLATKASRSLKEYANYFTEYTELGVFKLDSINISYESKLIKLYFNKAVSFIPLREPIIETEKQRIKAHLGRTFRKFDIKLYADGKRLEDYVPNFYRIQLPVDSSTILKQKQEKVLLKRPFQRPFPFGLQDKHLALWHSHGLYYESALNRWEWQRARLHTTVEDLLPMSYVIPYLTKMLENAGATTFIPRERDIQKNEVIIDDGICFFNSRLELNEKQFSFEKTDAGFGWMDTLKSGDNPFQNGHALIARSKNYPWESDSLRVARYVPDVPASGTYALYISYGINPVPLSRARYRINSLNGHEIIDVDQSMGSNTWIYLGHYDFKKGIDPTNASIEVFSMDPASLVCLDAIKIGGGMGHVARGNSIDDPGAKRMDEEMRDTEHSSGLSKTKWVTSESPRFMEAARYFLQYAGIPDSIVYNMNMDTSDYKDDYQCRGEWVNYLMGAPNGPTMQADVKGLGIPIDLSFAFHTDAGTAPEDSIIGTLVIYNEYENNGKFADGNARKVNRELTDMIQTEIVSDIRISTQTKWTRRGIWNKGYSEAYRANVPTTLLEAFSHQNLTDLKYGLDPRFRFLMSRAIYKAMVKFFAFHEKRPYVIQPLSVHHFGMRNLEKKMLELSWEPRIDSLEPSAVPDSYDIYIKKGDSGFQLLKRSHQSTRFIYELPEYGKIYSFRIVAVNAGGISFPSESLSVGINQNKEKKVLIVNAFDRICGPAVVDEGDFAGIAFWEDQGVPEGNDFATVGMPYDYDRNSPWLDDDSPGWGASHADLTGRIIPGNTFDYPFIHGKAVLSNGFSFISTSDEYFLSSQYDPEGILFIDLIFGEEKTTPIFETGKTTYSLYSQPMISSLKKMHENHVPLFISGAHTGTDLTLLNDPKAVDFCRDQLHFTWRSNHADKMGQVVPSENSIGFESVSLVYNTGFHPLHYTVEAPDAIEPHGDNAETIFRYLGSKSSAGVAYRKRDERTVVLGFPFESVLSESSRDHLMGSIIQFLLQK